MNSLQKKLLVILGPTATGKTDLALSLAKKFNGELVSCDSRQVYKGLDIGTGKLPGSGRWELRCGRRFWEIGGIKIWMYDVISSQKQYTVADYVQDATKVVEDVSSRGKLPIIVGGTGLYLKALLEGLPNLSIPIDPKLRGKLERLTVAKLQKKLKIISSKSWNKMNYSDRQNPRRLIRAIELILMYPYRKKIKNLELRIMNYDVLKIGLTAPKLVLDQRVDQRVVDRIRQGMIEEAKKIHGNGLTFKRMRQLGLEYEILADYLEGIISKKKDLIKMMQDRIHDYVRRQRTWFKKERNVFWFDITDESFPDNVEKIVDGWYHHPNDSKDRHFS